MTQERIQSLGPYPGPQILEWGPLGPAIEAVVSKPGEKSTDKASLVTTLTSNPELKVSDQDLKFLKSLKIKIDDDAA